MKRLAKAAPLRAAVVMVLGLACAGCATSAELQARQEAQDHKQCLDETRDYTYNPRMTAEIRNANYNSCRQALAYGRRPDSGGGSASSSTMDAAIMAGALASQRGR